MQNSAPHTGCCRAELCAVCTPHTITTAAALLLRGCTTSASSVHFSRAFSCKHGCFGQQCCQLKSPRLFTTQAERSKPRRCVCRRLRLLFILHSCMISYAIWGPAWPPAHYPISGTRSWTVDQYTKGSAWFLLLSLLLLLLLLLLWLW